jgi:hypothetical protein
MTEMAFGPYSTAKPLFSGSAPSWVPDSERDRVQTYRLYEELYWTHLETFRIYQRGSDTPPIYIPNPRIVVDTTSRYVAKGLNFAVRTEDLPGQETDRGASTESAMLARQWFSALFRREKFFSKFQASKLYGIMRGDYAFHVFANPNKVEGRKITIQSVNPSNYFPVYDDLTDPESLRAAILADLVLLDGKEFVRRLMYRKITQDDGTNLITSELEYFKPDGWYPTAGKEEPQPERIAGVTTIPEAPLDERIQAIPVYHIPHNPTPNEVFGNSDLRGIERVHAAVNQTITDEDLALILEGLGLYATDANPPTDDDGNAMNWILGPGRVLELQGQPNAKFVRINGVGSVGPYLDHAKYLEGKADEAVGVNEVAKGRVDVTVAESGIALALRLNPLLSRVDYIETFITDVTTSMWYDLATGWLPVYESAEFPGIIILPAYGQKLPVNRKERFAELNKMLELGIITSQFYLEEAEKLGYQFPDGAAAMVQAAMLEQQARTDLTVPSAEQRALAELEAGEVEAEEVTT